MTTDLRPLDIRAVFLSKVARWNFSAGIGLGNWDTRLIRFGLIDLSG